MGAEIPPFNLNDLNDLLWKTSDKVENSDINIKLKSMKELADEIEELIGKKKWY